MTHSGPGDWHPRSYRTKRQDQEVVYDDSDQVEAALAELRALPPLVVSWEVDRLKQELAEAQRGNRFVLQGGDCAESFDDCSSDSIARKLKILLQMSVVLAYGLKKPIVRIGRIAGQYAKPRSSNTETRDGVVLPSYRGDIVNQGAFTPEARRPDPARMLRGYERAALTLNFIRSLLDGGFADLHHPEYWDLDFVRHSPLAAEYRRIVGSISDSLDFMENVSGRPLSELERVTLFASHEGLHLPYEEAQTRYLARRERWYDLTTHFPWIGMRTADPDGAHVEFFRGVENPLGVKVSAGMTPERLDRLLRVLDPNGEPGRLTLIHRFGVNEVERHLPPLIRAVREIGRPVLFMCDPMHGNTETTSTGVKTRRFDSILQELELSARIHRENGSELGGVHIELTGDDVTECTGGARGLTDADLGRAYRSQVDPRLNYEQALELAMRIVSLSSSAPKKRASPRTH